MNVEVVRWRAQASRELKHFPRVLLQQGRPWRDWPTPDPATSDQAFETLFDVYYDERPEQPRTRPVGSVKILQRGRRSPALAGHLASLPEDCCSLGQTEDYYQALESLGEPVRRSILTALRDVTANEDIARSFEHEAGFRAALLRFPEAELRFRRRPAARHGETAERTPLAFSFVTKLDGFDQPHELDLEFFPEPERLGRLMAIIGRNGTGKTQLLARLAWTLWGLRGPSDHLFPERPLVGRIIAVSYSALDVFRRPPHRWQGREGRPAFDNYCYCGFRAADDTLRPAALFERLGTDLQELERLRRRAMWERMLSELHLLDDEPHLADALRQGDDVFIEAARKLAAGQKTALCVLTRILAVIRHRAFLLFDEPEQNLHPRLLTGLLRVLHGWLEEFDAHGVVATHSPLVLQEIPGRCVRVLERAGNVPFVRPYELECFGQNLSEILVSVFGLDERDQNYAQLLEKLLASDVSASSIEAAFGRTLSLGARMTLRALVRRRGPA